MTRSTPPMVYCSMLPICSHSYHLLLSSRTQHTYYTGSHHSHVPQSMNIKHQIQGIASIEIRSHCVYYIKHEQWQFKEATAATGVATAVLENAEAADKQSIQRKHTHSHHSFVACSYIPKMNCKHHYCTTNACETEWMCQWFGHVGAIHHGVPKAVTPLAVIAHFRPCSNKHVCYKIQQDEHVLASVSLAHSSMSRVSIPPCRCRTWAKLWVLWGNFETEVEGGGPGSSVPSLDCAIPSPK